MKTRFLFVLMLTPMLVGCGREEEPAQAGMLQNRVYTISDLGYIPNNVYNYHRVICLGAGALRYYSYIGDLNKLIAVENIDSGSTFGVGQAIRPYYDANKSHFATLASAGIGGPANQFPDMETLIMLEPDLVVSFYDNSKGYNTEMVDKLECPVISLSQGIDGVFDETTMASFLLLGKVFNRTDRATSLINYINSQKFILSTLEMSAETYYAGCIGNWGKTNLYGSYKGFPVFKYAKVTNVVDSLTELVDNKQVVVTKEQLLDLNPDKIFIDSAGAANFLADYKNDKSSYTVLDAIENKEAYSLMPYNAYYTNLEIQLMSTFYVASIAHKDDDLFKNMNMNEKFDEILSAFVNKKIYSELCSRSDSLGGYNKIDLDELVK